MGTYIAIILNVMIMRIQNPVAHSPVSNSKQTGMVEGGEVPGKFWSVGAYWERL